MANSNLRLGLFRLAGIGALVATIVSSLAAWAEDLPRYKLTVGQELVYRYVNPLSERTTKEGRFARTYICEWTVYVTRLNPDGNWRIIFRDARTMRSEKPNVEPTSDTTSWDGYFDLSPDGRLAEDGIRLPADPTALFPPLPPDVASLSGTWESFLALDIAKRKMSASAQDAAPGAAWRFVEEHEQIASVVQAARERRDYVFDRQQGLVTEMTIALDAGPKRGRTRSSRMELVKSRQLPEAEVKTLQEESDRYVAAIVDYQALMDRASGDLPHAAEHLDAALARLKLLEGHLTFGPLREMLTAKYEQFKRERAFCAATAEQFARVIDMPSAEWATTDLDGQARSLADYRGKVVVLDFWYRGCGWCMRLMPQIKQLAADFPQVDVAIVGMNSDDDIDDARAVIDMMKIPYETLRNGPAKEGIHSKYNITGWPTLVVIDPSGVVRHIHAGYSPVLRQELADKIRKLLAEGRPGAGR